jgi:hypothetical protein
MKNLKLISSLICLSAMPSLAMAMGKSPPQGPILIQCNPNDVVFTEAGYDNYCEVLAQIANGASSSVDSVAFIASCNDVSELVVRVVPGFNKPIGAPVSAPYPNSDFSNDTYIQTINSLHSDCGLISAWVGTDGRDYLQFNPVSQ